MKLLKVSSLCFFVLLVLVLASPVFAVGTPSDPNTTTQVKNILSNVSIKNAKIISQKGSTVNLSFDIVSSQKTLAGIKYSVKLIGETTNGQYIADEYVYPETFGLSPNTTIKKDVVYNAPQNMGGEYTLIITVSDSNGLPLGVGIAGKISNISVSNAVEILSSSCYLSVEAEKGNIKYSLIQGIDIAKTEKLMLNCSVVNHSKATVSVVPSYETHYRTLTGDKVPQEGGDIASISLKAGETINISLVLPKALIPQAYDVKTTLNSAGVASNSVVAHYVLHGESATILNFLLDKDNYKVKDVANISLSWAPSADSFPGSRWGGSVLSDVTLTTKITNSKQKECITPISQVLTKVGNVEISAPIIANCNSPIATIELIDKSGNILDQKILSFESKTPITKSGIVIIIILVVLIVAGLALYFINLKKKGYTNNSDLSKSNETNI